MTSRTYQLIRRGDQYAVRYRGWFGLWIYLDFECVGQLWPYWMCPSSAERVIAWSKERDRFKSSDVEVVSES